MKHKLKPLKEKEEKVCSVARICFVDGKEFLQDMKQEHMYFFVILNDGKEEVEEVPTEVADMSGEFYDIVSDNVHDKFPPIRKISHQMDLALGASLPNKEEHKMKLVKSEELNKQVHEFL